MVPLHRRSLSGAQNGLLIHTQDVVYESFHPAACSVNPVVEGKEQLVAGHAIDKLAGLGHGDE